MKKTDKGPTLSSLSIGSVSYVREINTNGMLRRRLQDLGFVSGALVEKVFQSPAGDPAVYRVRGTHIALRDDDAGQVKVASKPPSRSMEPGGLDRSAPCGETPVLGASGSEAPDSGMPHAGTPGSRTPEGEYVNRETRDRTSNAAGALDSCGHCPDKRNTSFRFSDPPPYTVALAGNPNTGKSTVFNGLTGFRQHVGNWPGKTVTRAEGAFAHEGRTFRIFDLPGTYSLLSSSTEEEIARDYIVFGVPDCTVVVVDATCLERNLNLVFQILETTDRVVVCVNLMDEARRKGLRIDADRLEEELGVPVVPTTARYGRGFDALKVKVHGVASGVLSTRPARIPLDPRLQEAVDELVPMIKSIYPDLPNARWIALRLIDGGDRRIREEVEKGLLADLAGRIGNRSLTGMSPDAREVRR